MIKNRRLIIVCLFLLELCMIFISYKAYLNKPNKNKVKENITEKKSFSMYIEKDGEYKEYTESNLFPSNLKYIFNDTESYCIDIKEDIVDNVLSYNNGKVTVTSNKTVYCYLYFDLDKDAPIVTGVVNNNNSTNATITISSNETGTYCVNTSATSTTNCTFIGNITKEESLTTSIFTVNGDYYVHVTDEAGNIGHSDKLTVTLAMPLGQYIIDNAISGLDKNFIGTDTLYRFSGTSGNTGINNYICLGTSTKCSSGSDNMYRIIGVEPSTGFVKVIKQTKYGENMIWAQYGYYGSWPDSRPYSAVVAWYNSVSFKNMIALYSWNIGQNVYTTTTREYAIDLENNVKFDAYVGIISISDYYMAYREDKDWSATCFNCYTSNWIHTGNNEDYISEWTMTRGYNSSAYSNSSARYIQQTGQIALSVMDESSLGIRPTFYLDSSVYRISGSGTSSDPFLVSI